MNTKQQTRPTVFISYSHLDEAWKDRLQPHLKGLENAGRIILWDDRKLHGGEFWFDEIKEAMDKAAVAVCLLTPNFLASEFCTKEEARHLLTRRERDGIVILPVLMEDCAWKAFDWIKETQLIPCDGKSIKEDFKKKEQNRILLKVADRIMEILNDPNYQPPAAPPPAWPAPQKIDIEHLPVSGAELFGRDKELDWLDQQWQSNTTRIASLIAWGGVGKSTLVNRWLERMSKDNYRGAGKVFGWSFYSQGTGERVTTADQFIQQALAWFGDKNPTVGSPWDRGQRLAELVLESNALLVLDGMEPLQADNEIESGKVKDPALASLLRELALHNGNGVGLCLITSRIQIADLVEFPKTCLSQGLDKLSTGAGRALLRVGGVKGSDAELEAATEAFGYHALALKLLAGYLSEQPGHEITEAEKLPLLEAIPVTQGRHARRVIAAFEVLLGQDSDSTPELALLRLLGLFDRPLERGPLEALLVEPAILGLTEPLQALSFDELLRPLGRLRQLGLIAEQSRHRPETIDAHPLLREHFQDWLQQNQPEAWREGNDRLFEYYRHSAKEQPDTLEEMTPLFLAMGHGCAAGRFQAALDEVYWTRIKRGGEFFSTKKLGAFGSGLAALAGLFEKPWSRPVAALSEGDRAFLLNTAGFDLRALGRLAEAVAPMVAGLEAQIAQESWKNAARAAGNLSELHLTLGELAQARSRAEEGGALADRSGDPFMCMASRTALADALFQSGQLDEAAALFQTAEQMQREREPDYPLLYGLQGYYYCDLLLAQGRYRQVQQRAEKFFEWRVPGDSMLDIALDHLTLGRVHLHQAEAEGGDDAWQEAAHHLDRAVAGLRKAGRGDYLPRGLLARTSLFRLQNQPKKAQRDLDELFKLARRSGMKLFEADAHLEQGRLALMRGEAAQVDAHAEAAARLIKETGYKRRLPELAELQGEVVV